MHGSDVEARTIRTRRSWRCRAVAPVDRQGVVRSRAIRVGITKRRQAARKGIGCVDRTSLGGEGSVDYRCRRAVAPNRVILVAICDGNGEVVGALLEVGVRADYRPTVQAGLRLRAVTPADVGDVLGWGSARIRIGDGAYSSAKCLAFSRRDRVSRNGERWIGTHHGTRSGGLDSGRRAADRVGCVAAPTDPLREWRSGRRAKRNVNQLGSNHLTRSHGRSGQHCERTGDSIREISEDGLPLEILSSGGDARHAQTSGDGLPRGSDGHPIPGMERVPDSSGHGAAIPLALVDGPVVIGPGAELGHVRRWWRQDRAPAANHGARAAYSDLRIRAGRTCSGNLHDGRVWPGRR